MTFELQNLWRAPAQCCQGPTGAIVAAIPMAPACQLRNSMGGVACAAFSRCLQTCRSPPQQSRVRAIDAAGSSRVAPACGAALPHLPRRPGMEATGALPPGDATHQRNHCAAPRPLQSLVWQPVEFGYQALAFVVGGTGPVALPLPLRQACPFRAPSTGCQAKRLPRRGPKARGPTQGDRRAGRRRCPLQ